MKSAAAIACVAAVLAGAIWLGGLLGGPTEPAAGRSEEMGTMAGMQTDIAVLGRLITLDPAPVSARWESRDLPGGQDWELIALLEYGREALDRLRGAMSAQPGTFNRPRAGWIEEAAASGGVPQLPETIDTALDPAPFRRSPLLTGYAAILSDSHILVVLQTQ